MSHNLRKVAQNITSIVDLEGAKRIIQQILKALNASTAEQAQTSEAITNIVVLGSPSNDREYSFAGSESGAVTELGLDLHGLPLSLTEIGITVDKSLVTSGVSLSFFYTGDIGTWTATLHRRKVGETTFSPITTASFNV